MSSLKYVFTALVMSVLLSGCFEGPTGPQGEKGEKGDTGEQGPQGEQGDSFFADESAVNYGNITITGDFEAKYTFDRAEYNTGYYSWNTSINLYNSWGYNILVKIYLDHLNNGYDGPSPGLYQQNNTPTSMISVAKGRVEYYSYLCDAEITVTTYDEKVIEGTFKGDLFASDNRDYTINIEGSFIVPR